MNRDFDEEKSIAILYANFRGKKRKINDWIFIANKVKELSEYYGSYKKLASHLGVSDELIRETLKLLDLPADVQQLVKTGKLRHEVAWRIASISNSQNQIKIAHNMIGLNTHDARNLVRLYRENPDTNVDELKNIVQKSKTSSTEYSLVMIPVKQIDYLYLKKEAHRRNVTPSKLIADIILPVWLKQNKK